MADDNPDADADQLVERTDVGVSVTSTLKRGSGTRDEDKHVVKAKGHTLTDAIGKHKAAMNYLEREVVDRARQLQPDPTPTMRRAKPMQRWRLRCPRGHVDVVERRGSRQHTAGAKTPYYCRSCKDGAHDPHHDHVVDAKSGRRHG